MEHLVVILDQLTNILKIKVLQFISGYPYFSFFDTRACALDAYGKYDFIAAGAHCRLTESLKSLLDTSGWKFGVLSYGLKTEFESSAGDELIDPFHFPAYIFFEPEILIYKLRNENKWHIWATQPQKIVAAILDIKDLLNTNNLPKLNFESLISKKQYLESLRAILNHIREGDIYEINFCNPYQVQYHHDSIEPLSIYQKLIHLSPTGFGGLFRADDQYIVCASPERFLQKNSTVLRSQPIKGTIKRSSNSFLDTILKSKLHQDKFISENVMIVDLMRNDLYRSSKAGTVHVPKLFEVQTYRYLHHLVSTIEGKVKDNLLVYQILRNTFPAGSMTGAPKIRAMQLISQYETIARGAYSGSMGYITPEGDFDFNVIIRSLIININNKVMGFQVGGAITYDSNLEDEFAETLIKSHALRKLFK